MANSRRIPFPAQVVLVVLLALVALTASCSSSPSYRPDFPKQRAEAARGTVLFVLTAAAEQTLAEGTKRPTGYFLNEFYEPYRAVTSAGYKVLVATPGARPAPIDPESLNERYWGTTEGLAEARAVIAKLPELNAPLSLAEARARAHEFQGLLVPGGQGVMVDLLEDENLHALLAALDASARPIGLICHAPAILTRMTAPKRVLPRSRVTSVSGLEEWYIETFVMGEHAKVRAIADALDDAGYRHESAFPGRSKAVRDCNLVTSQNPFSGEEFSQHYLAALSDYRQGARCAPYSRE